MKFLGRLLLAIITSAILAVITFFICAIIFLAIIPLISTIITGNKSTPDFFVFFIIGIPIIVAICHLIHAINVIISTPTISPTNSDQDVSRSFTTKHLKRYDNEIAITGDYFLPYLDFEAYYGREYKCKNEDSYTCAYCSRRNELQEYDLDTQSFKFHYTSSSICNMTIHK